MACGLSRWASEETTTPYRSVPHAWSRTHCLAIFRSARNGKRVPLADLPEGTGCLLRLQVENLLDQQ